MSGSEGLELIDQSVEVSLDKGKSEQQKGGNLNSPHQEVHLNQDQVNVLQLVANGYDAQSISKRLDVSRPTVNRILRGLKGNTDLSVDKYNCVSSLIQKMDGFGTDNDFYKPTSLGFLLLRRVDDEGNMQPHIPPSEQRLGEGSQSEQGDGFGRLRLRPHQMRSEHSISFSEGLDSSWMGRMKQFYPDIVSLKSEQRSEQQFENEDDAVHLDDSDDRGERALLDLDVEIRAESYRVEVFEDRVLVEIDFPERRASIPAYFNWYLAMRDKILSRVEDRLSSVFADQSIRIVSEPEHWESSMVQQEWAVVGQDLAEFFYENQGLFEGLEEYSRDTADFVVRNEQGEEVILIDRSKGEPELEFVHPEKGKLHAQNFSRAMMYFSAQDVSPNDLKAVCDLRATIDSLKEGNEDVRSDVRELRESMPDGLKEKVRAIPEIREEVSRVQERMVSVDENVVVNEKRLEEVRTYCVVNIERLSGRVSDVEGDVGKLSDIMQELVEAQEMSEQTKEFFTGVVGAISNNQELVQNNQELVQQTFSMTQQNAEGVKENAVTNERQGIKQDLLAETVDRNSGVVDGNLEQFGIRFVREKYWLYDLRSWFFGKVLKRLKWMELRQFTHGDLDWIDVSAEVVLSDLGIDFSGSDSVSEEVFFSE